MPNWQKPRCTILSESEGARETTAWAPLCPGNRPIPGLNQQALRHHQRPQPAQRPEYILRLIGQVITVSLETVKIVNALPDLGLPKAEKEAASASTVQ